MAGGRKWACRWVDIIWLLLLIALIMRPGLGQAGDNNALDDLLDDDNYLQDEIEVNDPLEPINRFFFAFNDKMYYWLIRPVSKAYSVVVPEDLRYGIDNSFHNLGMPVRLVNNLLQGKFKAGGLEVGRFLINTTVGVAGLADPAADEFGLVTADEDFGQTLGAFGVGEGWYLCLPLLGPSTVRDGVGLAGDYLVSPLRYLLRNEDTVWGMGLWGWKVENSISIHGPDYDDLHDQAFDPYVSFRDFYLQHRRALVADELLASDGTQGGKIDCVDRLKGQRPFNLAEARAVLTCAQQQGRQALLTRERQGNRLVYGVVVETLLVDE